MKTTEHNQPSPRLPMKTTKPDHHPALRDHELRVDHEVYAEIICGNKPYLTAMAYQGPFQPGQTIHLCKINNRLLSTGRWCAAEIGQVTPVPPHRVIFGLLNVTVVCN